jgi:hypothetical protein
MAAAVATLRSQTSLKNIFRTLQNQESHIFSNVHNTHSESITTCLENLGHLINPDNEDWLYDLRSFIESGVCHIARNYEMDRLSISPIVLNFLMTAIRSYNHIVCIGGGGGAAGYRFESDTCPGASATGNAFLMQVLVPLINAGALHVFPIGVQLEFNVNVPESFVKRSPSPPGPRRKFISLGEAAKIQKTARRRYRRERRAVSGAVSDSSTSGSDGGGRRRIIRRIKRRTSKYCKK